MSSQIKDNLTKFSNGLTYMAPNQPVQDSRVGYVGPIHGIQQKASNAPEEEPTVTIDVNQPAATEDKPTAIQVEEDIEPWDDVEQAKIKMTDMGFTPGEINLTLQLLQNPTGSLLAAKINRVTDKVLQVAVPKMSDVEIARGMEIMSYVPDIRAVMRVVPQERIVSLLANIRIPRVYNMASNNIPEYDTNPVVIKQFVVTIDGVPKTIMATDIREALEKAAPSGGKIAIIREV